MRGTITPPCLRKKEVRPEAMPRPVEPDEVGVEMSRAAPTKATNEVDNRESGQAVETADEDDEVKPFFMGASKEHLLATSSLFLLILALLFIGGLGFR